MKYFVVLLMLLCSVANADFITFSAEVNSGGSPKIVIDNRSSAGWEMIQATFDFNGTPVNLLNPQPLSFGTFGSYSTVNTIGGRDALTETLISNQKVQWKFSGMKTGDGYGISINLGNVRGSEMNGATIEALLRDINSGQVESLRYEYSLNGSGRSFPAYATASVPEPNAAGLLCTAVSWFLLAYRYKRGSL